MTVERTAEVKIGWRAHALNLRMAAAAGRYVPRIPRVMLDDFLPGIGEHTITLSHTMRERALSPGEAFVLALITSFLRPQRIFEIGTATGAGTLLMASQAPGAQIDTLDLGESEPVLGKQPGEPPIADVNRIGAAWRASEHAARITQHFGDSARFDYEPFRASEDIVFIDGAHTYPYVRSDSRAALAMARPGAVIVWDDCTYLCPGVAKAILELRAEGLPIFRLYGTRFAVLRVPPAGPATS